jgi:phosphoglycolate phosphatase
LHKEVIPVLTYFQQLGCRQFIVSAMEQLQLRKTVQQCGITPYFEELCGLNNHFAGSKVEIGKLLIESKELDPGKTLMIGDTIHDYEVAQAIGCSCLLIANGHQSKRRLSGTGTPVLENLNEIEFLWK